MKRFLLLVVSHLLIGIAGVAAGFYYLPILTAPASPPDGLVEAISERALYTGKFLRERQDSDWLHWGEGDVYVGRETIGFKGELAPGPDYKLYLAREFVETEADFRRLRNDMVRIADIRSFGNFIVRVPGNVDIDNYNTVIIWCETFGQFISSARYR